MVTKPVNYLAFKQYSVCGASAM